MRKRIRKFRKLIPIYLEDVLLPDFDGILLIISRHESFMHSIYLILPLACLKSDSMQSPSFMCCGIDEYTKADPTATVVATLWRWRDALTGAQAAT